MYLYQSYTWYAFIRQDFLQYYRYAKKLVSLFDEFPLMKRAETSHHIRAMHYLLNAHFDLHNHRAFEKTLTQFEELAQTSRVMDHDSFRMQAFIYLSQARINRHLCRAPLKRDLALSPPLKRN
ncbi:MAG: hypothetical protein FJY20_06275 [Bacteroidetes bacterium]|nr:hypothetical protein [Bacteroidota bacterium]